MLSGVFPGPEDVGASARIQSGHCHAARLGRGQVFHGRKSGNDPSSAVIGPI
jgi:hypothetical protein